MAESRHREGENIDTSFRKSVLANSRFSLNMYFTMKEMFVASLKRNFHSSGLRCVM